MTEPQAHNGDQPPSGSSLNDEQRAALRRARRPLRAVRRAVAVANFSAWSLAIFAGITLIGALWSWSALAIGLALGLVAWNEFRGTAMLRRFDLRGPRRLALNQCMLALAIVLYSGWSLWTSLSGQSEFATVMTSISTGDPHMDQTIEELGRTISIALYGTLGVVGPIFPLLTAWYYASRRKRLKEYLSTTPGWAQEVLTEAG